MARLEPPVLWATRVPLELQESLAQRARTVRLEPQELWATRVQPAPRAKQAPLALTVKPVQPALLEDPLAQLAQLALQAKQAQPAPRETRVPQVLRVLPVPLARRVLLALLAQLGRLALPEPWE
jgi:hypothetical protein